MFSNVNIKGLKDLDASLKQLQRDIQRKIAQASLNSGARIVKVAAAAKAPVGKAEYSYIYKKHVKNRRRIGQLRESIRLSRGKPQKGIAIRAIVFPFTPKGGIRKGLGGFYGIFIERGWVPTGPRAKGHLGGRITFKAHRSLARQRGNQRVEGRPFMQPALLQNVNPVIDAIARKMKTLIDKETWRVKNVG